jgi:hypothetical protein
LFYVFIYLFVKLTSPDDVDIRLSKWNHPVLYDELDDGSDRSDDSDSEKEPDLSKFFFVDEMQKVDSTKGKLPSGKKLN